MNIEAETRAGANLCIGLSARVLCVIDTSPAIKESSIAPGRARVIYCAISLAALDADVVGCLTGLAKIVPDYYPVVFGKNHLA